MTRPIGCDSRWSGWLASGILVALLVVYASAPAAGQDRVQAKPIPSRIWHFVLRDVTRERADWMADRAKAAGFDAVQILLTDGVRLDRAPWKPRAGAWSRAELVGWLAYVSKLGMQVIPELKLLTHQEKLFQGHHPDLMFNKNTYDPRLDQTYNFVLLLLDEIISIANPAAVHIGHDEVAGHSPGSVKRWLSPGEPMLPADLFLRHLLRIHGYLKHRGVQTWIWGDMLVSTAEFPSMFAGHLHGSAPGYGKVLRDKLPRDIVICDWHYADDQADFPSLAKMVDEGFVVIGATWEKPRTIVNFSGYAASHGASAMMATTWFRVQQREWGRVAEILQISGDAFQRAFAEQQHGSKGTGPLETGANLRAVASATDKPRPAR